MYAASVSATTIAAPPVDARARRRSTISSDAPRATASAVKACPSNRSPRKCQKRSLGRMRARVGATRDRSPARCGGRRRCAGRRDAPSVRQPHSAARAQRSACGLRRASSNGKRVPPTIWYVSCPFPATTTVSPGRASLIARSIAARRSSSTTSRRAPIPVDDLRRRWRADLRCAGCRWSRYTRSATSAAMRPSRALARDRDRRRSRTRRSAAARRLARRAQHCSSASGVCA